METYQEATITCEIVKILHKNNCTVAEASFLLDYTKRLIENTATVRSDESLFNEAVSGLTPGL